ncbi:hypothetical protein [Clostridium sp. AM58-1XD]|uniref:hypothetical protein n=1 Tax=Clostridium sp. AM58-1XD TaxID=2292307 RepID=UPI000E4C3231|nr:hypothetical protein [Clostridium sp. AM58-1XD]RGY96829.1 hypothetical protein DXA13_16165 [Clostridium sp. AM58-1XD]
MGTDENGRVLHLKSREESFEIKWDNSCRFIMKPNVIKVPGVPAKAAGMMELDGELISLFYPGELSNSCACAVIIRKRGGGFVGLLADEIDGGT